MQLANKKPTRSEARSSASQEVIRTVGLTCRFGGVTALSEVDMSVYPGEILGVIGPNGAGKTTLFNLITGVYRPSSGQVLFEGHDVGSWRPHQITRAGIARTFQSVYLFSDWSVLQNVSIGQSRFAPSGLASLIPFRSEHFKQAAYAQLERLGLTSVADLTARQLPYATQRRVEIAGARE